MNSPNWAGTAPAPKRTSSGRGEWLILAERYEDAKGLV